MRLRHIEVFHAVYVTGSVSAGARALNVSQPTVSKVLKHAEDQLGFKLFDRVSGRLIPSEKGIKLFAEIEPLFDRLNDLNKFTKMLASTKTGHLRFAMTPAFGLEIAPVALANFSKNNSDITIETETLHANQVVRALLDDVIDIGLVFDAPNYPGIASNRIAKTGFVCVAPEQIELPVGERLHLRDIKTYPIIMLNQKSVLGQLLNRKLSDAIGHPSDSQIIVETYHLAKRLVKQNAGIAIIDAITALSGDTSGLQFRGLSPEISINVDIITRLNEPGAKLRVDFILELDAAMQEFQAMAGYKNLINDF